MKFHNINLQRKESETLVCQCQRRDYKSDKIIIIKQLIRHFCWDFMEVLMH